MLVTSIVLAVLAQAAPAKTELAGVVVDAQGKPVAGVEVLLSSLHRIDGRNPTLARTTTDAQGRFRHQAPSTDPKYEIWTLWAYRPGASLAAQAVGSTEGLPRPGSPIRLTLGPPRSAAVQVLDPIGRPVEGALVRPGYFQIDVDRGGGFGLSYSLPIPAEIVGRLAARTDARGVLELAGLPPGVISHLVHIEAPRFGEQTVLPAAGKDRRRTARLAPIGRLVGHVLGPDPGRARGIRIEVTTSLNGPGRVGFDPEGHAEAVIDELGRFEFPALAVGKVRLTLHPRDGGRDRDLPTPGVAIEAGKNCEVTIPLPWANRLRTVAGRVLDQHGRAVAGAVVLQSGDGPKRTRATTDDHGRFRIDGVDDRPAFLFARKAGYRFHGQLVEEGSGPFTMVLTRTDEKVEAMRTRPSPLPHREELALARRVIGAYADKVLKEGGLDDKVQLVEALAWTDPERVLAEAEKAKFSDPIYNDIFRAQVIRQMAHDDPEAAAEVAESAWTPYIRAFAYLTIFEAVDPSPQNRPRRLELLDQALLHVRGVKDADKRLPLLGRIADLWLDLGETDKATRLLREGEKLAREMPGAAFAGFARGAFAEELAQIDLDAALTLTRTLSDPRELDRHHGNIAHELAGKDPAAAERILAMVRDSWSRDDTAIRVGYRMAPVDLDRARRIADGIRHTLKKPYALGVMAQALAGSAKTRPVAVKLLAAAFDELSQAVDAGTDVFNNMESAAVTAASLLPVAEIIDPELVPEYLWRSLSFRRPTPGPESDPHQDSLIDDTTAGLAMRIARYDPATAGVLLEPVARRMASDPNGLGALFGRQVIVALALVNPQRAATLLERLPDTPPKTLLRQTKDWARRDLAALLGRPAERRWKYLQWKYFHAWVPDVEEMASPF
jgi:hypothetical protein